MLQAAKSQFFVKPIDKRPILLYSDHHEPLGFKPRGGGLVLAGCVAVVLATEPITLTTGVPEPVPALRSKPLVLKVLVGNRRPWAIQIKPESACCQVSKSKGFEVIPPFSRAAFEFLVDPQRLPLGEATTDVAFSVKGGGPIGKSIRLQVSP